MVRDYSLKDEVKRFVQKLKARRAKNKSERKDRNYPKDKTTKKVKFQKGHVANDTLSDDNASTSESNDIADLGDDTKTAAISKEAISKI